MKNNKHPINLLIGFVLILSFFMVSNQAVAESDDIFDVVIQVGDIKNTLGTADELITSTGKGSFSLTDTVSSMLSGLNWIDNSKSIVIGTAFYGNEPDVTVFIPTVSDNEQIVTQYNAVKGKNYYVFKPLTKETSITPDEIKALEMASEAKRNGFISTKIAIAGLMEKNRASILNSINSIDQTNADNESQIIGPSPEEIQDMLKSFIDMAEQLTTITFGFDLVSKDLITYFDMSAKEGTDLFTLFTKKRETGILPGLTSDYQITYKSLEIDYDILMDILDNSFGSIYSKMGFDLGSMDTIISTFTGEQSSGISITNTGIKMGSINVLTESSDTFLEAQFIPWILKTGLNMSEMIGKSVNKDVGPYFTKGKRTKISGIPVYGILTNKQAARMYMQQDIYTPVMEEFRLATYKNFLLVASDDEVMSELIDEVESINTEGNKAKLYEMNIDAGEYISSLLQYMAGPDAKISFPITDRIMIEMDSNNGKLSSSTSLNIEDLKNMTDFFTTFDSGILIRKDETLDDQKDTQNVNRSKYSIRTKNLNPDTDAEFWTDRAGLVATYGNDKMAVIYYNKAIKLDPDNGDSYFNLGISYGELGHYSKAFSSINKALDIDPDNGMYFYGRGRVFMLMDDSTSAEYDFRKAAELKYPDAVDYLDGQMN